MVPFIRALIPFIRALIPHDLITSQSAHLLTPSHWGLGFYHESQWDTDISSLHRE